MYFIFRALINKKPKIGDLFIFDDCGKEEDPFILEEDKNIVKIIDVKNKWVKFEYLKRCTIDRIGSYTFRMFNALFKPYKKD